MLRTTLIASALSAALARPATRKQLADQGIQTEGRTADEFASFIRAEHAKWAKVVSLAKLAPEK